ncbi:MAG: molybdopterin-dependent oxidoreductase [Planctomycetota bacterium]|nr:molybdopterin-dependent oxidoreductase [Planctomycetaceae bacterium]MDQ3332396.1 molybdopterin-dependent oxidoreductase [Planctomycetota bacterium]
MPSTPSFNVSRNRQIDRRRFLASAVAGSTGLWLASPFARLAFGQDTADHRDLIFHQKDPLNGEPPLGVLPSEFVTPTKHFYIRNHGNIPDLDRQGHRLKIEGLVEASHDFSLQELSENFEKSDCVATMTCAGNRRREHNAFKPVSGVQWDAGAIGNATWGGIKLSDLLKHCRLKEGASHVWFEGADDVSTPSGMTHFGGSIPLDKAMTDHGQAPGALVAWEMNGQPLTPEHGRPLRTVVPGYIGARSVKWLSRIIVGDRPSPNHYVRSAYKLVTAESDLIKAEQNPIYRFPTNVAICEPAPEAMAANGSVTVRGYALPTGLPDARLREVEVSANGGRRWVKARLLDEHVPFCWSRWEANVPVTDRTTALLARAVDTVGGVTPDRVTWNTHGYLYNGWHHVPVKVAG